MRKTRLYNLLPSSEDRRIISDKYYTALRPHNIKIITQLHLGLTCSCVCLSVSVYVELCHDQRIKGLFPFMNVNIAPVC